MANFEAPLEWQVNDFAPQTREALTPDEMRRGPKLGTDGTPIVGVPDPIQANQQATLIMQSAVKLLAVQMEAFTASQIESIDALIFGFLHNLERPGAVIEHDVAILPFTGEGISFQIEYVRLDEETLIEFALTADGETNKLILTSAKAK